MKRILILGAGEMQLPVIQKANDMGAYAIVADFDANAPGLAIAHEKAIVSTIDAGKVLELARDKKIDGILTTSDYPVNVVAKVSEELGLASMSADVARLCTNKYLQRTFFREHGIKTPQYRLINNAADLGAVTHFPSIIKPVDSSASRGVKKVNSSLELTEHYEQALHFSRQAQVIVEDFIEGREFSVETYTQHHVTTIVAITEKLTNGEDEGFFVEDTHIIPARISTAESELIKKEVLSAISAMQLDNCPTHTEVKLNPTGAYIIEMACRLGGDYITSDLVPLATGVDMLANLVSISTGEQVNLDARWQKTAAVQFLNSGNYNRCTRFIETGNPAIIRSEIKPFHTNKITSSMERMGYVLLQTESANEMSALLDTLNKN